MVVGVTGVVVQIIIFLLESLEINEHLKHKELIVIYDQQERIQSVFKPL